MRVLLNSKALYKRQAFQLIIRLPKVPKLHWFSLHFSSSAFPSIYWPNCKNNGILQPHLPQQFVTVSTVTARVADSGLVKLDCPVRGCVPRRARSVAVRGVLWGAWSWKAFEPLEWGCYVSSVFLKQRFLYFRNLYNKEGEWYHPRVMVTHVLTLDQVGLQAQPLPSCSWGKEALINLWHPTLWSF